MYSIFKNRVIPVFFAVDDRYAPFLAVTLQSILEYASRRDDYRIYILIDELSENHRNELKKAERKNFSIEFVEVGHRLAALGDLHVRDYYTKATYYRFLIPTLFPQYDKGLYLDCDIILLGDLARLYDIPLGWNLVGAVTDEVITDIPVFRRYAEKVLGLCGEDYFNAGILSMNLKEMRRADLLGALNRLMEHYTFRVAQDQDYLNVLCHGRVAYLPLAWNKTAFPNAEEGPRPMLVHFKINWKPWHYRGVAFEREFWNFAFRTGYYRELLTMRQQYSAEDRERDCRQYEGLMALARQETEASRESCPLAYAVARQKGA